MQMSTNPPPWKAPSSAEEEKQRFDSMMADFLKEDEQPPKGNQSTSNQPPSQQPPSGGGNGGLSLNDVARFFDERQRTQQTEEKHNALEERVKKLESAPGRKRKSWWSPLF